MSTYDLAEVFTSTNPAKDINFIKRPKISRLFDRAYKQTGRQIIVYGPSGAGKTSLILNKQSELNFEKITTQCISAMTFDDILYDAFSKLEVYHKEQYSTEKGGEIKGRTGIKVPVINLELGVDSAASEKDLEIYRNAVGFKPTAHQLVELLGKSGKIWVIEDFHKIIDEEKKHLAQLMKMFMDKSVEFPSLKIIAIGAVNTARQVLQYDNEMRNRVSEIEVPLMKSEELESIIIRGENLLNINFADSVKQRIVRLSSGLPSVTHQLCYLICESADIDRTSNSSSKLTLYSPSLDSAIEEYIRDFSDTFRSVLEKALKSRPNSRIDNATEILKAVLSLNKEYFTVDEVRARLQLIDKSYQGPNLEKYIFEFTTPNREEIFRYLEDSEQFYFSNAFFKAYFHCHFVNDNNFKKLKKQIKAEEFRDSLNFLYQGIRNNFDYDEEDDEFSYVE